MITLMNPTRSLSLIVLLACPVLLFAGAPLICHPYDIGDAKSLPAGKWKGVDPAYDRSNLESDTLALLTPETPMLVRMETLRRAAIYATGNLRGFGAGSYTPDDRDVARRLLKRLKERTQTPPGGAQDLALFDLGFFAETLRQTHLDPSLDGYSLLEKVATLRPNDPHVPFALALAGSYPERKTERANHLARARAGAKSGSLLAVNLGSHFSDR